MAPASPPELFAQSEALRKAVSDAVDQALAVTRTWQRELDARITRIEGVIGDLQLSDRVRAATFSAIAPTPNDTAAPRPIAAPPAPPPVATPAVRAPLVNADPPFVPVQVPAATYVAPPPARVPNVSDEPHGSSMFPEGFDGGKRKRTMTIVAIVILIIGVAGLAVLAVASQAVHGL
jgi:hypothetical protein